MPTAFTSPIEDREDFTFEEYVWRCARGTTAFSSMRDLSLDAPVLDVKTEPYYAKAVEEARARLRLVEAMTDAEAEAEIDRRYRVETEDFAKAAAENAAEKARYAAMLARVVNWVPPTPDHESLKRLIADQIHLSAPRDLSLPRPVKLDLAACASQQVKYREKALAEHLRWVELCNRWLADLRKSVPPPRPRAS